MLAIVIGFRAGGWIAFAASFVVLEEVIAIIVRFINPGLIWQRPAIPLIFVSCLGSVVLCTGYAADTYHIAIYSYMGKSPLSQEALHIPLYMFSYTCRASSITSLPW